MASTSETVLVVDDDAELLGMVDMVLEGAGYRVITATNGYEALQLLAREKPAIILLDMKMPGMDGWKFAREFRSRYGHLAPIVVLTAAEDARKRAEEIGADGYLGKPFDIEELIRVVRCHVAAAT